MGSDIGLCYEFQRCNILYEGKTGPCAAAAAAAVAAQRVAGWVAG